MKFLILALSFFPLLSFADANSDDRAADRADQAMQRAQDRFDRMDEQRQRHGVGFVCVAADGQARRFTSPWLAGDVNSAKRSALGRCALFWNKGCRLVQCAQQRF